MAYQSLNLGTFANDSSGDTLRTGGDKINDNFAEIYSAIGNGVNTQISLTSAATNQVLKYNGVNFVPSFINQLETNLDVNSFNIVSSANGNINVAPNGTGNVTIGYGSNTATFNGTDNQVVFPTNILYKNQYSLLANAPAPTGNLGYFYTINGDDSPYVNMNITAGGAGDSRVKLLTQYSGLNDLTNVDVTTNAPTNNQVLKWNGTNWVPGDDQSGLASINLFSTIDSDSGSTTANSQTDTLTISGGTDIGTAIVGDELKINYTGTPITTFAGMSDTDFTSGIVQGNSLFYNGTDWTATNSPIIWWELSANQASDYTFDGPGFPTTANDPTLYVYRGFTYAFDNTVQGTSHPFRIQTTQGLSGNPYTDGQSGSGTAVLYWTVPMDAPNVLYYQCTIHALMNGTINVVS